MQKDEQQSTKKPILVMLQCISSNTYYIMLALLWRGKISELDIIARVPFIYQLTASYSILHEPYIDFYNLTIAHIAQSGKGLITTAS